MHAADNSLGVVNRRSGVGAWFARPNVLVKADRVIR